MPFHGNLNGDFYFLNEIKYIMACKRGTGLDIYIIDGPLPITFVVLHVHGHSVGQVKVIG